MSANGSLANPLATPCRFAARPVRHVVVASPAHCREERIAYQRDLEELAETKAHILVTQVRHCAAVDGGRGRTVQPSRELPITNVLRLRQPVQDKAENLRWEHEIVEQRYLRLAAERDALFERFQAALHDVKQKTGFKTLLLEKRITATAAESERTTIALSEVLAAAHLDSAVVGHLEAQIGDVIGAKDAAIAELEADLARVVRADCGGWQVAATGLLHLWQSRANSRRCARLQATKHDAVIDAYLSKMDEAGAQKHVWRALPAPAAVGCTGRPRVPTSPC